MSVDVLTFGETMLRLTAPGRLRLEQAQALEVWVAGSESNVAAALTALGCTVTWVSRLPDNPLGRKIEAELLARRIDVSHVVWAPPEERVGTFYAEHGAGPRQSLVIYDRAGSSAAALCSEDLPDSLFERHRHLHMSGITPALSPSCADAVRSALDRARAYGLTISVDVNYRAKLWSVETAAVCLSPLIENIDLLFCSRVDAQKLFRLTGGDNAIASALKSEFGIGTAVLTCGGEGAVGCDANGCASQASAPVTTVERFGSGDAFAGGFLSEYLAGAPLPACLRRGAAAAALKRTIAGDLLIATRLEIEAVDQMQGGADWR